MTATTLTVRDPEDLLAIVPVVLGFHPSDSLVMLTFDGRQQFHARLGLPPPEQFEESLSELVSALLTPAVSHQVRRVAFVFYCEDRLGAARTSLALRRAFAAEGIEVFEVLRAHDGEWCRVPKRVGRREPPPTSYDDTVHPFRAQAVFEGLVTLASRAELAESVSPHPDAVTRVARLLDAPASRPDVDATSVFGLVARCTAEERAPDDAEAVWALRAIGQCEVRDALVVSLTREAAACHLTFWTSVLRRAPRAHVADPAVMVGFCAWLCGHGALAWCALDRCFEVDPEHRLGRHLAEALTRAISPSAWDEVAGPRAVP